jgi:hypothetical protein
MAWKTSLRFTNVAKTRTFNVDSSTYTGVTVQGVCKRVIICEDGQIGTAGYYLSGTGSDSDRVLKPAGSKKEFTSSNYFLPGDIPGYIKAATGSMTFSQEEEGA